MRRLAFAAVLLLAASPLAAAISQAEPVPRMKSQNNLKQMGLAATDESAANAQRGPSDLAQQIRTTKAEIELVCPETTYILSSGTKKGSCKAELFTASCSDGGNGAKASCYGCSSSSGAGSCKTK